MILGQLRIWARQAKNAPLPKLNLFDVIFSWQIPCCFWMKILFFVFCTISMNTRLFENSYFWLHGVLSAIIWNISKKASKKYIFKFLTTSFQISDILFIVFCIPSTAVDYALTSAWPFGDVWCRLSELSFLNNLNLFSQYFIFFRGRFFFLFVFFI